MKSLRFLPLCLTALALPVVLTGCNKGGDMSSTSADTNAAPAAADTNAPAPATAPAAADTNAPAATNAAPASTNSGT